MPRDDVVSAAPPREASTREGSRIARSRRLAPGRSRAPHRRDRSNVLTACHLGFTSYPDGLRLQESLVRARADGLTGDWLLFPDHPPVLTAGRGTAHGSVIASAATLRARGVELFEVARGGDVTWHGPGQLVGYTICDLARRGSDLHRFLRDLEAALIDALSGFGIRADRTPGRTGVWVGEEKIASLGIAVRRWVSYHGFALNVSPDLGWFDLIHPCGLRGVRMTSIAARLGAGAPAAGEVRRSVAVAVARRLGYDELRWAVAEEAVTMSREADPDEAARADR
jgi:lipoate-protein ligase B